eukprot:Phypoly_transcript_08392.p1 GENE.Phypoly_transcript_08392~~Phypoly_transcript_08392.p1  ORF type:complete len:451 (+),score=51.64 Phypoly_transcript_08392:101-1453(+)
MRMPFVLDMHLFSLPDYTLSHIFTYFNVHDLAVLLRVCKEWRERGPAHWYSLDCTRIYASSCASLLKLTTSLTKFARHGTTGMTSEELNALAKNHSLVSCIVPASAIPYLNSSKLSSLTLLQRPDEKQMAHLQSLPVLREVSLLDFPIDGASLTQLSKITSLRSLAFRTFKYFTNRIHALELSPLKLFTGLHHLEIESAGADLHHVTTLTSLRSLAVEVKDHVPDAVLQCTYVTSLRINTSENLITSSENLHTLCTFPNLVSLSLLTCGNKGEIFPSLYSTSVTKLEVCDYNSSRTCALPSHPIKLPSLKEVRLDNIALKENIKIAFTKSPITRMTLIECVIFDYISTWTSVSTFPDLCDLSIQSCDSLDDLALQTLATTPKLTRLQILQKRGLTSFTLLGLTSLAVCATLRVFDLALHVDDAGDITQENVAQVFKERKDVAVMVTVTAS